MIVILQEADELLYRAALSVEKRCYEVVLPDGTIFDYENTLTATEIKTIMGDREYELVGYRTTEPLAAALFNLDDMIRRIRRHGDKIRFFLSPADKSNFRYDKVVTKGPCGMGYKAGRPPRPLLYNEVRTYLIEAYGAEEIHGFEADDALGIYAARNTILSHIDKDINMIPGKHLHWTSGRIYDASELGELILTDKNKVIGTGLKWFYFQLLTGDRTDNIGGIKGCGPKTAYKLLDAANSEKEYILATKKKYMEVYPTDWEYRMLEAAALVWICRNKDETGDQYLRRKLEELC